MQDISLATMIMQGKLEASQANFRDELYNHSSTSGNSKWDGREVYLTFIIISGGMQWVSSSYNLERISNSLCGDCCSTIMEAVSLRNTSQSHSGTN